MLEGVDIYGHMLKTTMQYLLDLEVYSNASDQACDQTCSDTASLSMY